MDKPEAIVDDDKNMNTDNSHNEKSTYLTLCVGGIPYYVERAALLKYSDSFFGKMLNSSWKEANESTIYIDRDGKTFQFVYDFIRYGELPKKKFGISMLSLEELQAVYEEAKFYHLPSLARECKSLIGGADLMRQIGVSLDLQTQVSKVRQAFDSSHIAEQMDLVYPKCESEKYFSLATVTAESAELVALLRSSPFVPSWITGDIPWICNPCIFKSSTIHALNIDEILQHSTKSPAGANEILGPELDSQLTKIFVYMDLSSLAPKRNLELRPCKLAVYQPNDTFEEHKPNHSDLNNGDVCIGMAVLVLNSPYVGGEIYIGDDNGRVQLKGYGSWVVMHDEVALNVYPVTSGTRVLLIFDLVLVGGDDDDSELDSEGHYDDDEDDYLNSSDYDEEEEEGALTQDDEELIARYKEEFCTQLQCDLQRQESNHQQMDCGRGSESEESGEAVDSDDSDFSASSIFFWRGEEPVADFWLNSCSCGKMASVPLRHNVDGSIRSKIHTTLDRMLEQYASVSIATKRLYLLAEPSDALTGKDSALFDMLTENYKVSVTPILIGRRYSKLSPEKNSILFQQFYFHRSKPVGKFFDSKKKHVLIMRSPLPDENIVHYCNYECSTRKFSYTQETVHLWTAIVVSKRLG